MLNKKNNKLAILIIIFSLLLTLDGCSKTQRKVTKPSKKTQVVFKGSYSMFGSSELPHPKNTFGNPIEYLTNASDLISEGNHSYFVYYNENNALKFYKNLNLRGYGDKSRYFRWKTTINKGELYSLIEKRIPITYKNNKNSVLTLSNGSWESLPITSIGKIKNIQVAARGRSGVITHLKITTGSKKYLVIKELNIRKLLATGKPLYGSAGGTKKYAETPVIKSVSLLPSAYLGIEERGNKITFYGGGNGHGVGMPQYSVHDLTSNHGETYKSVLSKYYKGAKLTNIKNVSGLSTNIKVGISSNGIGFEHSKVKLKSGGKIKVNGSKHLFTASPNNVIEITNSGGKLTIKVNGKVKTTSTKPVSIDAGGYYITLIGVKKAHTTSPNYRGTMTIIPSKFAKNRIRIINHISIENYLKQVLPSEMPRSFGVEALKAQAVAARTYAASNLNSNKYAKYGFDVTDTTSSQVYNNGLENSESNEAIEHTSGKILIHDGKPIQAKYFSTSSGFTEAAHYIW